MLPGLLKRAAASLNLQRQKFRYSLNTRIGGRSPDAYGSASWAVSCSMVLLLGVEVACSLLASPAWQRR